MRAAIARTIPALVAVLAALPGCSFGPKALERTHGKYATAVQRVEEEQFLKNVVRLRYAEAPRNLDVAAIAAQYEFTAGTEARPFFSTEAPGNPFRSFASVLPFASIEGSNRPTVSLDPQDDASTIRQFLTPISDETLVFLTQSGWPVSSIVRIWADRINGVPNWVPASGPPRDVPPDFQRFRRAAGLLQVVQDREWGSIKAEDRTTELSDPLPANAVNSSSVTQAAKDGFEYRRKGDEWVLTGAQARVSGEPERARGARTCGTGRVTQPECERGSVRVGCSVRSSGPGEEPGGRTRRSASPHGPRPRLCSSWRTVQTFRKNTWRAGWSGCRPTGPLDRGGGGRFPRPLVSGAPAQAATMRLRLGVVS